MYSSDEDSFKTAKSNSSFSSCDDVVLTLSEILNNNFKPFARNFNVCHINAQSIPSHFADLLESFDQPNLHAVLVSETWLKPSLPSVCYPLPGYILVRNDRTEKRGGGVAIYLKSNFAYKIVLQSPSTYSACAEYLFLEVDVGLKLILGVVYCPPNVNFFSKLENSLETLMVDYTHFIIMGDFNTCLLNNNYRSSKLTDIIESLNMNLLDLLPTHHTGISDTLLDLIVTSHKELVAAHGQFAAPAFSHHDLIYSSLKIRTPKPRPVILNQRNFARLDLVKLNDDASLVEWSDIELSDSIDIKVSTLQANILKLFDKHAPVHPVKLKRPPSPWLNSFIRKAMARRDRAFRMFKRDRTDLNWATYKKLRNLCNRLVRNAKRRYISEQIELSTPAGLWKFLRSLGLGKPKSLDSKISLDLNSLNAHFSITPKLSHTSKQIALLQIQSIPISNIDLFVFEPVSQDRVLKIISSLKSKAVGCDDIGRTMIMHILNSILPTITHIINFSLTTGQFPDLWRRAHIIPLPKVSNPISANQFRPISILPFLSKVIESEVHRQVTEFLSKSNLFNSFQSGFRAGHSTTTALLKVTEDIRLNMENRLVTVLVLIDFSNAFNSVDHELLLTLLPRLMLSSSVVTWFSSYLQGRRQAIRDGQVFSDWHNVEAGVPQGGILSPLLFSLFINLLAPNIKCQYHMYADDLQLYSAVPIHEISNAIAALNLDLLRLQLWSDSYGISVNPNKCQAIVIGSSRQLVKINLLSLPSLTYNSCVIRFTATVKDLGVIIDSNLSWSEHVKEISRKFFASFHSIIRLKNFLPVKTKIFLVNALLVPIIDYADVCFVDLNADQLNKLDRLLNTCIRFIFGLRKFDHVSEFRAKLKWLPIRERRSVRILCLLYSILNNPVTPDYLKESFTYVSDTHVRELRSSSNLLLAFPAHDTSFRGNSFTVAAVRLWNALPTEIKKTTSKDAFKHQIRSYFIKKYFSE